MSTFGRSFEKAFTPAFQQHYNRSLDESDEERRNLRVDERTADQRQYAAMETVKTELRAKGVPEPILMTYMPGQNEHALQLLAADTRTGYDAAFNAARLGELPHPDDPVNESPDVLAAGTLAGSGIRNAANLEDGRRASVATLDWVNKMGSTFGVPAAVAADVRPEERGERESIWDAEFKAGWAATTPQGISDAPGTNNMDYPAQRGSMARSSQLASSAVDAGIAAEAAAKLALFNSTGAAAAANLKKVEDNKKEFGSFGGDQNLLTVANLPKQSILIQEAKTQFARGAADFSLGLPPYPNSPAAYLYGQQDQANKAGLSKQEATLAVMRTNTIEAPTRMNEIRNARDAKGQLLINSNLRSSVFGTDGNVDPEKLASLWHRINKVTVGTGTNAKVHYSLTPIDVPVAGRRLSPDGNEYSVTGEELVPKERNAWIGDARDEQKKKEIEEKKLQSLLRSYGINIPPSEGPILPLTRTKEDLMKEFLRLEKRLEDIKEEKLRPRRELQEGDR